MYKSEEQLDRFKEASARLALRCIASGALLMGAFVATVSQGLAADLLEKARDLDAWQCLSAGSGFYYIPGTDTCLRVGGYLRTEGYWNNYNTYPANYDQTYSISTGAAIFDARSQTEYGTLRSYMESRFLWRTSAPWSDGPVGSAVNLYYAYIQFGSFTFGKARSFFDFYANDTVYGSDPATIGSDSRPTLAAYTLEFGNGLSASLSLEDAASRLSGAQTSDPSWPDALSNYQAGVQVPDLVGNLRVVGEWGKAQISGALHQTRGLTVLNPFEADSTWGYAVQAGLMLNLPALGQGDVLWLQTAYADGAMAYLGLVDPRGGYAPPDAFTNALGLIKGSGWNATASLQHNWTDKWATIVFGGYADFSFNDPVAEAFYGMSGGKNYNVGGSILFTPVKNLTLVLQYDYTQIQASDYIPTTFSPAAETTRANQFLLYAQRNF